MLGCADLNVTVDKSNLSLVHLPLCQLGIILYD